MPSCHDHLPPVDLHHISAVSILSGEHRVILQVVDCLDRIRERARRELRIPVIHAEQALEVIRTFADRCHHAKEEDILFPALEAQMPGFGPTQVMRSEHVIGRGHVAGMTAAVRAQVVSVTESPVASSPCSMAEPVATFVHHAGGYVDLLRTHIAKEDDILFRMAQTMLTPEADAALVEAYRAMEHQDMGDGTHDRMLALADVLADAYGVPRASEDPVTFTLLTAVCGCHNTKH